MAYLDDLYYTLNIQPNTSVPLFVRLSQNENGRRLYFALAGIESNISSSTEVTITGTKPDGIVYSKTGSITNNVVLINEDVQMTAVAGTWDAKIKLVSGGQAIASARIRFVIDADTVDPGAIPSNSRLEGLIAEAQYYAEEAKSSSYGAPLVANAIADMIDHTRVYVYTGSETGYTAGNWYYWNGTAWTDGGIYNSIAIHTDKTLSAENEAADSKIVGNELKYITSVEEYADLTNVQFENGKYLSGASGEIKSNVNFALSDYIELPEGVNSVTVNRNIYVGSRAYPQSYMVWWYDENHEILSRGTSTISGDLLTSEYSSFFNAKYIRVNFSKNGTNKFVKFNYYNKLHYIRHILAGEDLNDIVDAGIYINTIISSVVYNVPTEKTGFLVVYTAPFGQHVVQQYITQFGSFTRRRIDGTFRKWFASGFGGDGGSLSARSDITDLNDLLTNRIYLLSSSPGNYSHLPFSGFLGVILCFSSSGNSSASGNFQMTLSSTQRVHIRRSWGTNATWSEWEEVITDHILQEKLGFLYEYSATFTSQESLYTDFYLQPGMSYVIKFYNDRSDVVNIFKKGHTSVYRHVYPWENEVIFTNNDETGNVLTFYNPHGQLDTINIKIFGLNSIKHQQEKIPEKYIVNQDERNGDYTSLTKCLFDLKDNHNPKIIEIWEGDYDIYSEYKELYDAGLLDIYTGDNPSMDYFPYCVWVPENTHIIGKGIVRLKWMPDPETDDITPVQCRTISPLNVAATCTIENVEVYCKNGRYCLHNDGLGKPEFTGAIQRYINCKFFKYPNDTNAEVGLSYGFLPTTGFGIDRSMHHVYQDCTFINYAQERAFYGHSRGGAISGELQSSDITLDNCVIDTQGTVAVKFGNAANNRNIHIRTMFNGCYISSLVRCQLERSGSAQCANGFDVQYLNCGNVSMQINDTDNPYEPKAYNTTLTMVD